MHVGQKNRHPDTYRTPGTLLAGTRRLHMGSVSSSCRTVAIRKVAEGVHGREQTMGQSDQRGAVCTTRKQERSETKRTHSQLDVHLATAVHPPGTKVDKTTKSFQTSGRTLKFIVDESIDLRDSKLRRTPGSKFGFPLPRGSSRGVLVG